MKLHKARWKPMQKVASHRVTSLLINYVASACKSIHHNNLNVVPRSTGNTNSGTRELTLKWSVYSLEQKDPPSASPSMMSLLRTTRAVCLRAYRCWKSGEIKKRKIFGMYGNCWQELDVLMSLFACLAWHARLKVATHVLWGLTPSSILIIPNLPRANVKERLFLFFIPEYDSVN